MNRKNLTSLNEFVNEKVGHIGTEKRDKFEKGLASFKLAVTIRQAKQQKVSTTQSKRRM